MKINYEAEVKNVYPNAIVFSNYNMKLDYLFRYWIDIDGKRVTPYTFNIELAWQSIYNKLAQQHKL
jgi:hypothetical protein